MKDENNDAIMIEFVGFRAKMYALHIGDKKKIQRRCKKQNNVARSITFNDYARLD